MVDISNSRNDRLTLIGKLANVSKDLPSLYARLCESLKGVIPIDRIAIIETHRDDIPGHYGVVAFTDGIEIAGRQVGDKRPLRKEIDPFDSLRFNRSVHSELTDDDRDISSAGLVSRIQIPIGSGQQLLCVLWLMSVDENAYSEESLQFMDKVALQVAPSILSMNTTAELNESEAVFRDLVETSEELIWRCDSVGNWTFLNPAWTKVLGYEIDEMIGRPFKDFLLEEFTDADIAEFQRISSGGSVRGWETEYLTKSGDVVTLSFNSDTLFDAAGEMRGTRGTARDLTRERQAIFESD